MYRVLARPRTVVETSLWRHVTGSWRSRKKCSSAVAAPTVLQNIIVRRAGVSLMMLSSCTSAGQP